jgi:hypothetical protein
MAVGAGGNEPAGDADAGSEPDADAGGGLPLPAGEDPEAVADGETDAEGGLPLPAGPLVGRLLAVTGRLGRAVTPGNAMLLFAVGGIISWTSIRKSKEGIVEAQSGETEICAAP